jgi:hypothetical protein
MKKLGLLTIILAAFITVKAQENSLATREYNAKGCFQMAALKKDLISNET